MRDDMRHILSEGHACYRGKEKLRANRRQAKLDPENADQICSMRKIHIQGWNNGHSCERGAPMTRFLRSRVGQPWSKVYSEICAGFPLGNDRARSFREDVDWKVETNVKIKDGVPHEFCGYSWDHKRGDDGYRPLVSYNARWPDFYVDPRNGILCEAPVGNRYGYPSSKYQDYPVVKDPDKALSRFLAIDGIWYEIIFRRPTQVEKERQDWGYWHEFYDVRNCRTKKVWHHARCPLVNHNMSRVKKVKPDWIHLVSLNWQDSIRHFGEPLFPMSRRQINSREIRRVEALTKQSNKKAA